jgi:hypothetical protein
MEHINIELLRKFKAGGRGGYWAGYVPGHEYANAAGIVYLHRYLKSIELGYWIPSEFHVHHKDGNKENNNISNLELLSSSDHGKLHAKTLDIKQCLYCFKSFAPLKESSKFCSTECYSNSRKTFEVSKEELEVYIWTLGFTKTAKIFKVSDNAIKKRAIKLGCRMPPPYFTQKSSEEKATIIKNELKYLAP